MTIKFILSPIELSGYREIHNFSGRMVKVGPCTLLLFKNGTCIATGFLSVSEGEEFINQKIPHAPVRKKKIVNITASSKIPFEVSYHAILK